MSLLQEMLDYCERTGTRPTYLGTKTVNDTSIISQMQRGRMIGAVNASRIRAMMAKHPNGMHTTRVPSKHNPNAAPGDNRTHWEVAADNRAGTDRLLAAIGKAAPTTEPTRALTFEEKLALVASGKAKLVSAAKPQAVYSYSLTGSSL